MDQFSHTPLTSQQLEWLSEIVPFALGGNAQPVVHAWHQPVVLEDESEFPAIVGKSADSQALVGRENERAWFIPKQSIRSIRHDNIQTCKGRNDPELVISVVFEDPNSSNGETASVDIFSSKNMMDSTRTKALAKEIADWLGLKLTYTWGPPD